MTKLQLLHQALNERLKTTVVQIVALVSETVLEYEAETVRVRMENEALRRKLVAFECPETPVELPEQFSFECLAEELGIKQEPACDLLCSESTTNLTTTPNIPASDAEMDRDVTMTMTQSYMAPVEQTEPQQNLSRKQKFSFTCLVCSKVFARKITLDIHKRIHSKTRPYDLRNNKTDQKRKWKRHRFSQMQRAELSNTPSGEPDQNSNGASTDPEASTPLSKEEPEEFTAETEQITSHLCPEDHERGHLTQNLCENVTDSIKIEDDFIKTAPEDHSLSAQLAEVGVPTAASTPLTVCTGNLKTSPKHVGLTNNTGLTTSMAHGENPPHKDDSHPSVMTSVHLRPPETQRHSSSSQHHPHVRRLRKQGVILQDVLLNHVSAETEHKLYLESAGANGQPRADRFVVFLFKRLIPLVIYQNWTGTVNFDGSRGKNALPNNLRQALIDAVGRRFPPAVCNWKLIRDRLNELLRNRRTTFPLF